MKKATRTCAVLEEAALPTEQQKENMLNHVLVEGRKYDMSLVLRLYRLITVYPWRFAFCLSAVQAVLCAMIWGSGYTSLILGVFGG